MGERKAQLYFFLILFGAALILSFLVFLPYLKLIALSATFAVIFSPLYEKIMRKLGQQKSISALLTILAVVLMVLVPLAVFGFLVFQEAQDLYVKIQFGQTSAELFPGLESLSKPISFVFPNFQLDTNFYLKKALSWTVENFSGIFVDVAKAVFNLAIGIIALFYFLKDGKKFIGALTDVSPLPNNYDKNVFLKLEKAVGSVVRGALLIALLQGILTGIGFWIFGIPSPALWAGANTIMALIPAVGTAAVSVIGIAYLLVSGNTLAALLLLIWSVGVVGFMDNLLRPQLIGGPVNIHPFLILISVLGGLQFLGAVGIILGPIILSLLFALGEAYTGILREVRS